MAKKPATKRTHPGRRGHALTAPGVTPDELLGALLKVKPADVAKLEKAEAAKRKPRTRRAK